MATGTAVRVRTPDAARFGPVLTANAATVEVTAPDLLEVTGLPAPRIGELAAEERVVLHELTGLSGSLEDAYLALTQDEVEYHAGGTDQE